MEPPTIYRYKFTNDFMILLHNFSKIHQYDSKHDFKDAWTHWCEDNRDTIMAETRRLLIMGYDGDIDAKMFKSARYYFRTKVERIEPPKKRTSYIQLPHELLDAIDEHINANAGSSPKQGFDTFYLDYRDEIQEMLPVILGSGITAEMVESKIKKTYKNRHFVLSKKLV